MNNKKVVLLNTETHKFEKSINVSGSNPSSIVFDGTNMWVTNVVSRTVSVMSLERQCEVHVIKNNKFCQDFIPYALAFDGTYMWIGSSSLQKSIYRVNVNEFSNDPEEVSPTSQKKFSMTQMVFDGAFLWIIPFGVNNELPKFKIDVVTHEIIDLTNVFPNIFAAFGAGIFDGRHLWIPSTDGVNIDIEFWMTPSMATKHITGAPSSVPITLVTDATSSISQRAIPIFLKKIDVETNVSTGSITLPPSDTGWTRNASTLSGRPTSI